MNFSFDTFLVTISGLPFLFAAAKKDTEYWILVERKLSKHTQRN